MKRFKNANEIWNVGASNPRGVARALVEAMDESPDPREDAAVQVILDQLCFLCGLPQPSLSMPGDKWDDIMFEVMKNA